jgi:hypothetical protein
MADNDMVNGNFDPQARYAALDERVTNLRTSFVNLEGEMRSGFTSINSNIASLSNELRGNSRTQWPVIWSAIGVSFAVLAAVGALAYRPVLSNQDRLEAALVRQMDTMTELGKATVSRQEMDWRSSRGIEDRNRTDAAIGDLRDNTITRLEYVERNRAADSERMDLQRQIDLLRSDFGAVYGTRDVIVDLKKEIDNLRQRFNTRGYTPP